MSPSELRAEIDRRMKEHRSRKFPRGGPDSGPVADAVVTLAEYGGHVAGPLERYQRNMPLGSEAIELPVELERVFEREHRDDPTLAEFRAAWAELRDLAELLSKATHVPLQRVTRRKSRILVSYDYGQGGVWAFLIVESKDYIARNFPELVIWEEPPSWMSAQDLEGVAKTMTIDADRQHPFLASLRAQRGRE